MYWVFVFDVLRITLEVACSILLVLVGALPEVKPGHGAVEGISTLTLANQRATLSRCAENAPRNPLG